MTEAPNYIKQAISIHALREEGDLQFSLVRTDDIDFYPRPPRGGRRLRSAPNPA